MAGNPWTREEIIIAYALYCVTPLKKINIRNPLIRNAAEKINHSISSLVMRMRNFMAIDPDSKEKGCAHVAKTDITIFEEFRHDWYTLSLKAEEYLGFELFSDDGIFAPLRGSKPISSITERSKVNKERAIFRDSVRATYECKCCITQIAIPELLIASHIRDYSKCAQNQRVEPTNGLLLNTFHDKLFDKGLITVLPDYTIKLSETLKNQASPNNEFAARWIYGIEGTTIDIPKRFKPDAEYLKWHNQEKFARWNK